MKSGLYKDERMIMSPQGVRVDMPNHKNLLNLCANNYLGLSNEPEIINAAKESFDRKRIWILQ